MSSATSTGAGDGHLIIGSLNSDSSDWSITMDVAHVVVYDKVLSHGQLSHVMGVSGGNRHSEMLHIDNSYICS